MGYGDKLADKVDVTGKHVLMVDFSLKRPAMIEAAKVAKSIVVLDHHKTAETELFDWCFFKPGGWPSQMFTDLSMIFQDFAEGRMASKEPIVAFFDMDKSGARLAWEFCFPDMPIPRVLEHIEDRDLWRFKLPYTREVTAAVRSYVHDFACFDQWAGADCGSLIWAGGAILRAHTKTVTELCGSAYLSEVAGYTVPVLNVPYQYASDCGHELLKRYPDAPFAATWARTRDGKEAWSLRSEDKRVDVAAIAASLGGGGHRNASGFALPALMSMNMTGVVKDLPQDADAAAGSNAATRDSEASAQS
jgi:hypothetical protein